MNENKVVASIELPKVVPSSIELSRKGFITNYPPFRHWKRAVVGEMLTEEPINIYVHSPYCIQKCAYCFYKTVTLKESQLSEIDRYVDAVCREIEIAAKRFHLKGRPVDSIYFGGGTPTLLSERNMSRIIETLRKNLSLGESELTVEAETVTFTQKKADMLERFGVNRLNLGIQSFCDEVVRLTGRKDTEKKRLKAIEIAKNTGAVVNIDLISGLAGEMKETWAYSVKRALAVDVQSITVYKMELYANTAYYAGVRKKTLDLPTDKQELEFMRYAMEQFEQAQYLPQNWYTFTKLGGYEHIYNRSIWQGNDCYAFGVSGFGRVGDFLFQNTNDLVKYAVYVEEDELPINRSYRLTGLDKMIRDVLLGMKLIRLDLKRFQSKYGFKLETLCASTLEQLKADGFISLTDDEIELTKKGILYGDYVGKRLTARLQTMKI